MSKGTIAAFLGASRSTILTAAAATVTLIAVMDWHVGNTFSLGLLYIVPMVLAALVLRPGEIAAMALLCAFLRACFDVPSTRLELILRFIFASLSYFISALLVTALVRNRRLVVEHLARVQQEQALRQEAEEQLRLLAESSPAAIVTADQRGVILAANRAAAELFSIPDGHKLQGRVITQYLPLLEGALRIDAAAAGFRTAAQCYGRRENGEMFLAETWFSTYRGRDGVRLAAIVVDSSEEMRDREEQRLRQLHRYNRIAAGAVSHDVRNLCSAISMLSATIGEKRGWRDDEDLQSLIRLVKGLEHIAELGLRAQSQDAVEEVPLRSVLDSLRIVIEPGWREADGRVEWCLPNQLPHVIAEPHGLLQALLNLAQNSYRAVLDCPEKELTISAAVEEARIVTVRFEDTGRGVACPDHLFQPFQPGAEGAGLGLYISRALLRSYGGDLRFEPRQRGSCFVVELQTT
jgi:two-component system sensor kinase FixL